MQSPSARLRISSPVPRKIGAGAKSIRNGLAELSRTGNQDATVAQINLAEFGIGPRLVPVVGNLTD